MGGMNKKSNDKNIIVSFSLLMRLFEFMHEDAANDVDMHKVMEKLVAFSDGVNPLTMDVYDCLIADVKPKETSEYASDEDLENANTIGTCCSTMGCDLEDVDYSDAGVIIADVKDNGYGASNSELEQFWKGYEDSELEQAYKNIEQMYPSVFDNYCYCQIDSKENQYDDEIEQIIKLGKM